MASSLLSCPLCFNPHFTGVDALRATLIAVANSDIVCPVCDEVFLGLDKLTIHLFAHVSIKQTNERVKQSKRETSVSRDYTTSCDLDKQLRQETNDCISHSHNNNRTNHDSRQETGYNCTSRDHEKQQTSDSSLSHHDCEEQSQRERSETVEACIRCDICSYHFSDEIVLDLHQKLLHQTVADTAGNFVYHCHLCSKRFEKRGSLMVHLRVVHFGFVQHNQRGCGCGDDKRAKGARLKQWECDVCTKSFTTKYFLKKHKRLHTGEMPYHCSRCDKHFTFQQSYHKHLLYHSDEKPHVCSECGRSFKELSTLHNHERIHSGERPFSCETCGKRFRQRVSYLVHRRIHTGAMPYKCTACDKKFRYKVSERSHKCPRDPPGTVVRSTDLDGGNGAGETVEVDANPVTDFSTRSNQNPISVFHTISEDSLKSLLLRRLTN